MEMQTQSSSTLSRVGNTAKEGAKNALVYVAAGACATVGAGIVVFFLKKIMPKTWNSLKSDAKISESQAA